MVFAGAKKLRAQGRNFGHAGKFGVMVVPPRLLTTLQKPRRLYSAVLFTGTTFISSTNSMLIV
jgi:hypothetical protein